MQKQKFPIVYESKILKNILSYVSQCNLFQIGVLSIKIDYFNPKRCVNKKVINNYFAIPNFEFYIIIYF